jgi:hypothetical protein
MEDNIEKKQEPQPIGSLFGIISYYNEEDLNKFIEEMNNEQALYTVVQAARAAYKRGVYGIEESEVISKAIRVLTTPPPLENDLPEPEIHQA